MNVREMFAYVRLKPQLSIVNNTTISHEIGGVGTCSKAFGNIVDPDYDELATTLVRCRSSSNEKLSKVLDSHVKDVRLFLDSLAISSRLRCCQTICDSGVSKPKSMPRSSIYG